MGLQSKFVEVLIGIIFISAVSVFVYLYVGEIPVSMGVGEVIQVVEQEESVFDRDIMWVNLDGKDIKVEFANYSNLYAKEGECVEVMSNKNNSFKMIVESSFVCE